MKGKLLIVDTSTGKVLGWLGEGIRSSVEIIKLLELDLRQYESEFVRSRGDIYCTNFDTKELLFNLTPQPQTKTERIIELEDQLLIQADDTIGGLL